MKDMFRGFFLIVFLFLIACDPGKEPYNPEIPYSKAWWDSAMLRCALQQNSSCVPTPIPPSIFPDKIPDTGQTLCYDTTTNISCGNGTYPRQDADFLDTPSNRSYIGPTAHSVYTNDYTTLDSVRGLVWRTCADGLSGPTCGSGTATATTYANAPTYCAALNAQNSGAGYAGITTWRMPSIFELERFANIESNTAVDSSAFPGNPSVNFISDTPYSGSPSTTGWHIQINAGFYDQLNYGISPYGVRCVSGTSLSTPSYTNNGDGTVTDNRTGLFWQGGAGSGGTNTWQGALSYCSSLSLAGKSWRLPNINELLSIVDYSGVSPAINATYFPGTASQYYWSSSTARNNLTYGFAVFFTSGLMGGNGKSSNWYVRCVSGP
ncbi:DUF1566 domain-containing protein [Leptospira yasudae]|uniref:DUF1566 domain-containing protein n=1 Tax=Leptospira yasudae TaxID=2202201 RepID=A0A6N4QYP1_9LEPT|nr:DUF1566 domain-containing protein [Leptospira yasudae]TGL77679.1 DUF1566 domain-containing protein [Leptospira yasudae]TGL82706.1 DUF1566 domain-containing protein [Leptospira yasudae]TGL86138.1 DUF1566 domain-containing protein [Leptospira yasudae]